VKLWFAEAEQHHERMDLAKLDSLAVAQNLEEQKSEEGSDGSVG
jgi:hypothetical protein